VGHVMAGNLSLAHGTHLSVELGLLEAEIKNMCFLAIFGHTLVAFFI
jgi:hypothetical protein